MSKLAVAIIRVGSVAIAIMGVPVIGIRQGIE